MLNMIYCFRMMNRLDGNTEPSKLAMFRVQNEAVCLLPIHRTWLSTAMLMIWARYTGAMES